MADDPLFPPDRPAAAASARPPAADRPRRRQPGRQATLRHLLAAVLLLATFSDGVGIDRYVWQGSGLANASSSLADRPEFAVLQQTWDLLHDQYVQGKTVNDQALIYGASAGMVDAVGDTGHSRFLDPEEAKDFAAELRGEFIGIGIQLDFDTGRPVVAYPLDGSPAEQAGIRSGDVILEINGTSTDGLTTDAIGTLIRGDAGTSVTLSIRHADSTTPATITVTRAKITLVTVTWTMLPGNIALIRLVDFSQGATDGVTSALKAARAQGAKGIILDLRDNPGGLVTEALGVAGQFLPTGTTVYQEQNRDGNIKPVPTDTKDGLGQNLPMVALVNHYSASAAEIVAAALRDAGRATLIGERTFGTGTVLTPFQYQDGSLAVIGTALWLTPKGEQIWKKGVAPDQTVPLPVGVYPARPKDEQGVSAADLRRSPDVQLVAAVTRLDVALGLPATG